jgi:hypothetical protein
MHGIANYLNTIAKRFPETRKGYLNIAITNIFLTRQAPATY